jgi:hypothetical protein
MTSTLPVAVPATFRTSIRRPYARGRTLLLSPRGAIAGAAVLAFFIAVAHGPAGSFVYDAAGYWAGSIAAVSGQDFFYMGGLEVRGALSTLVYLPAALVTVILGPASAGIAVLVQNALLIAVLGAILIPALVGLFAATPPVVSYVSALATAVLLGGFVPYPLADLWALSLVLAAVLVVAKSPRSWSRFAVGGMLLGAAFNLRPAYLVPVILIAGAWGYFSRSRVAAGIAGFLLAFVPQVATNAIFAGTFAPWPVQTFIVSEIQTKYAGFVVRYDTLGYIPDAISPQLFYCSPGMAANYLSGTPNGMGELALSFAHHVPTSLKFVAQKVAASLQWSSTTPYAGFASDELSALALSVLCVSALGILGLAWYAVKRHSGSRRTVLARLTPLFALWLGCVATLGFATPEARFAVPLVVLGIVGCLVVFSSREWSSGVSTPAVLWACGSIALVICLFWLGQSGLDHPMVGDVDALSCSSS